MKPVSFLFSIVIMGMVCTTMLFAQGRGVTDFNTVTLTIEAALTVTGGLDVPFNVTPGVTYSVKTDGHVIPVLADGTDTVNPLTWGIDGTTGFPLSINFTLPTRFYSVVTGSSIPLSFGTADGLFDNSGAGDGLTGVAFNPNSPYHDFIGPNAHADVYLGYRFSVPLNTPPTDDYLATFALTIATTGF